MKNDLIKDAYEQLILREYVNSFDFHELPIADISHHHDLKLNEEMIDKWLNKGKKYDDPVSHNVDLENKRQLHSTISETSDKFHNLANEHVSNLNNDHYKAVSAYVTGSLDGNDTSGSRHVNEHLIESHKNKTEPKPVFHLGSDDDFKQELHLRHLDDAINQNTHHEKFTTYSG
ncbi:MAG TPA: hypothetical protein VFM18_03345, partial [Methanosarcina sp.]|nr:hypothetical protein [Methanosarcina sp.]